MTDKLALARPCLQALLTMNQNHLAHLSILKLAHTALKIGAQRQRQRRSTTGQSFFSNILVHELVRGIILKAKWLTYQVIWDTYEAAPVFAAVFA